MTYSILEDGLSALMYASSGGHTETVEMLLERGTTMDLPDNVRNTIHSSTSCMCVCMRLLEH